MRVMTLVLLLVLLTGCQSLSSTVSFARVRVIDISPDAPPIDIYQGNDAMAYNLSFGSVTSYVSMAPGSYTFTVDFAGSRQVLSSIKATFSANTQYTVLVSNPAASLRPSVLTDQGQQSLSRPPSIRLIHQAEHTGAVDVYVVPAGQRLASVNLVVTNLVPGAATEYLAVPAGPSAVVMLPAGAIPSVARTAIHTGIQMNYVTGSARTLILLDRQQPASPDLQVITTIDADPAN